VAVTLIFARAPPRRWGLRSIHVQSGVVSSPDGAFTSHHLASPGSPRRSMLIRDPPAPVPADSLCPLARDDDGVVMVYLLLELRKANRTIQRLREVALAARAHDAEKLRVALASLFARDLRRRRPRSRRVA